LQQYPPKQIRNVVLLGHSNSGKTSLVESVLFSAGAINRLGTVNDGTTTSDFEPEEIRRKISISLSLLPLEWKGTKINFLDTPGYPDFVGEVKSGLRVTEAAIIVVCAASGVEVGTEQAWAFINEARMPGVIFVNKMDRDNADFFRTLKDIEAKFGAKCLPLQLPIGAEKNFKGIVDIISGKTLGGGQTAGPEVPAQLKQQIDSYREKLVEVAVEADDAVLSRYLEGGTVTDEEILRGLKQAVIQGRLTPVLVGSGLANIGAAALLDIVCQYLPSPADVSVEAATSSGEKVRIDADPSGPLAAFVFKTTADPYVGKLSYFRVYSGTVFSNSQVWNAAKNSVERLGQLFILRGKNQEAVQQVMAGDIGAVARLSVTSTGDSLTAREKPVLLPPVNFPQPNLSKAVYPKSKNDLDKMSTILPRLCEEDPTLTVRRDSDTAEIILSGLGETHLEAAAEKMARKFGVEVKLEPPKIPYRETILKKVTAEYKHKKQTGGHGQYGHVVIELEPLPRGTGFEFAERVVGGAVPKNYYPAVEKGINEARQEGVLAGYPVIDVRATLTDGSSHPVDSSEIAFKIAAAAALKKGLTEGQPVLLEPVVNLNVAVPDGFVGDIISDLNTKRGRVMGMTPQGGVTTIQAQVPLAEVMRYSIDLRSITQGRGTYSMEFSHYEEVPAHVAQKVIAEKQAREAEKQ
jgi:elongation factor G